MTRFRLSSMILLLFGAFLTGTPNTFAADGPDLKPGDVASTTEDGLAFGTRDTTSTTLPVGTELTVTEVRGTWVGGHVTLQGKRCSGWVQANKLRRVERRTTEPKPASEPRSEDSQAAKPKVIIVEERENASGTYSGTAIAPIPLVYGQVAKLIELGPPMKLELLDARVRLLKAYYEGTVVTGGLVKPSDGGVQEVYVGDKKLTLKKTDFKDGYLHTAECGTLPIFFFSSLMSEGCVLAFSEKALAVLDAKGTVSTPRSEVVIPVTQQQMKVIKSLPPDMVCLTSAANPVRSLTGIKDDEFVCVFSTNVFSAPVFLMAAFGREKTLSGMTAVLNLEPEQVKTSFLDNPKLRLIITQEKYADLLIRRGGVRIRFEVKLALGSEETSQTEHAAWETAVTNGTPTAFAEYFKKYPDSARIKTQTKTLRGCYWFRMNDPKRRAGVIVTVEGTDLFVNVSLEEAKALKVIDCRPAPVKSSAKGRTFNSVFAEIIEGGFIVGKKEGVFELVEPRDNVNSTVVLSADGKRLLTWDVRNAQVAERPNPKPTFVAGAAAVEPFNDLPAGLTKEYTPESQEFTLNQSRPE